jgi:hypothetical protein
MHVLISAVAAISVHIAVHICHFLNDHKDENNINVHACVPSI